MVHIHANRVQRDLFFLVKSLGRHIWRETGLSAHCGITTACKKPCLHLFRV